MVEAEDHSIEVGQEEKHRDAHNLQWSHIVKCDRQSDDDPKASQKVDHQPGQDQMPGTRMRAIDQTDVHYLERERRERAKMLLLLHVC